MRLSSAFRISDSARYNVRSTIPIWMILIVTIALVSVISEPFRSDINIGNLLAVMAPLIIVACGQCMVVLLGGIDLSVGSVMSLATVVAASYASFGGDFAANIAIVLGIGLAIGLVNGCGVILGINPLIMTLSTLAFAKGAALLVLSSPGGSPASTMNDLLNFGVGLIPLFFILLALAIAIVLWYVLSTTTIGRCIYATGGSVPNAAKSGIHWQQTTILVYAASGLLAAVAGLALLGRVFTGDPLSGDPYTLDSITAVVLGGVALTGGRGSLLGAVAGAMLLALIDNLFNIFNIFSYYQYVAKGLILIVALLLYSAGDLRQINIRRVVPQYLLGERTP
jgi:ribose transport system permease protein